MIHKVYLFASAAAETALKGDTSVRYGKPDTALKAVEKTFGALARRCCRVHCSKTDVALAIFIAPGRVQSPAAAATFLKE